MEPHWRFGGLRGAWDGAKMDQDKAKMGQDGAKMAQVVLAGRLESSLMSNMLSNI